MEQTCTGITTKGLCCAVPESGLLFLAWLWAEHVGAQGQGALRRWGSAVRRFAVPSESSLLHPSSPAADVCYKKEEKKKASTNGVVTFTGGLFLLHI